MSKNLYRIDDSCGLAVSHQWFQCPAKRDPEAEADAELGALLRKLPEGYDLLHGWYEDKWQWLVADEYDCQVAAAKTPEDALRWALEKEAKDA